MVFGRFIEENGHKPSTCAEPQAVHKVMADNPNIKPSEVRMNTVEVRKGGKNYPQPRCSNCKEFDIGIVNTDPGKVNKHLDIPLVSNSIDY